MKNLFIAVGFIIIFALIGKGQNIIQYGIVKNNLSNDEQNLINKLNTKPYTSLHQFVKVNFDQNFDENGIINISLPHAQEELISFEIEDILSQEEDELIIASKNSFGEFTFFKKGNFYGGHVLQNGIQYDIFPYGENHCIIYKSFDVTNHGSCAVDINEYKNSSKISTVYDKMSDQEIINSSNFDDEEIIRNCGMNCGTANVDIIVVIPQITETWLLNNYGWLNWFYLYMELNNMNTAMMLSGVHSKTITVKWIYQGLPFSLTGFLFPDKNTLSSNSKMIELRDVTYRADILAVLTPDIYAGASGISNSVNYNSDNKFIICEVQAIGFGNYVFAHEVGHQCGLLHTDVGLQCPRGHILDITSPNKTIMVQGLANGDRIQHFSNPTIKYLGVPTGTDSNTSAPIGTRDAAGALDDNFCEVSAQNSPLLWTVGISLPLACKDQPYNVSASVVSGNNLGSPTCIGPYSYQWSYSKKYNGTFTNLGTNNNQSFILNSNFCPQFYLRLKVVSSDGCIKTITRIVKCQNCVPSPPRSTQALNNEILIYPKSTINDDIEISSANENIESVTIFNSNGVILNKFDHLEVKEFSIKSANLSLGINFVEIVTLSKGKKIEKIIKYEN